MAQILIRGLDEKVVERLKERARRNNRSLAAEIRTILEAIAAEEAIHAGSSSMDRRWPTASNSSVRIETEGNDTRCRRPNRTSERPYAYTLLVHGARLSSANRGRNDMHCLGEKPVLPASGSST